MSEQSKKLNMIERIQKALIIRKLKNKDFTAYQNITNETLKNDIEILELAWEIAKQENYHEFPEFFQKTKLEKSYTKGALLKYLSLNIQEEFCKKSPALLESCSPEIQLKLGADYPEEIQNLDESIQMQIVQHHAELLCDCKKEIQKKIIDTNDKIIFYASKEVTEELLLNNPESPLWESYLTHPNQTLDSITSTLWKSHNMKHEQHEKYKALFFDSRTEEQLKEQLDTGNYAFAQYCNIDTQEKIYELLKDIPSNPSYDNRNITYYTPTGSYINNNWFSKDFILLKFKEIYGNEKAKEYEQIIDDVTAYQITSILRTFLNQKSSIIEKVDSKKVIKFLETYMNEKKERENSSVAKAYYYNEFYDIVKEAYGEKALEILSERPGLNFEDIENPEILSKEILNNFSKGFIHDLLSYDFGEEGFYMTKIAKNPEDLQAFKQYYTYISSRLGENATTMKMCIERYKEFQEILKDAIKKNITGEQLEKIYAICICPKNIANITKTEEIDNIDEKILNTLYQEIEEAKKEAKEMPYSDFFDMNIYSENILFSYTNPSEIVLSQLNNQELKILNYLKTIDLVVLNSNSFWLEKELAELKQQNISISTLFFEKYKLLTKIKEIEMKQFKEKIVTGREQIEENIKTGKYGVKRIIVDEIEIIDLGTMPVNFALHTPNMNNSLLSSQNIKNIENSPLTFEDKSGISTISARAEWENDDRHRWESDALYVYWNFDDNEIMALKGNNSHELDADVSHARKMIKASGHTDLSLTEYKNQNAGTEIAFYRRYRNHKKIEENPRYGGKVIPDGIFVGSITPEKLQIPTKRFGRNIPIICRGKLQTEEEIKRVTEMIKNMKKIQMFNQMFLKENNEEEVKHTR